MNITTTLVEKQVNYLKGIGLTPVPVIKGYKRPAGGKGWNTTPPQWNHYNYNVGLLLGNGLFAFDADNSKTVEFLDKLLLKYNPPTTLTRGGKHYLFKTDVFNWEQSWFKLKGGYDGEIRVDKCMVMVAPSETVPDAYKDVSLGGWKYTLEGSYENIPYLPIAEVHALIERLCKKQVGVLETLNKTENTKSNRDFNELVIPVIKRDYHKLPIIMQKLKWLSETHYKTSYTSNNITYDSRSEVFQSVVVALIRFGYNLDQIYGVFIENNVVTDDLMRHTVLAYDRAIDWLLNHKLVQMFSNQYFIEHDTLSEGLVYKAVISLGYQKLSTKVGLSTTELMKLTGLKHRKTIKLALNKLIDKGYLEISEGLCMISEVSKPFVYRYGNDPTYLTESLNKTYVLGKHGETILLELKKEPSSQKELINTLGITRDTCYRNLEKLIRLKLVVSLKIGRMKIYTLAENHETVLYELVSDYVNDNYLKVANETARYQKFKQERNHYHQLKVIHGAEKALTMIKGKSTIDTTNQKE